MSRFNNTGIENDDGSTTEKTKTSTCSTTILIDELSPPLPYRQPSACISQVSLSASLPSWLVLLLLDSQPRNQFCLLLHGPRKLPTASTLSSSTWPTDPSSLYGITPLAFADEGLNPTDVQGSTKKFSKGERVIYALNRGSTTGYVSAMTLQSNGTLKVLNSQQMEGGSPAHLALSPKEDFVSVANYVGSLSLFPLNADGTVGVQSFYQNFPVGSKVVMDNQTTGHIHSTAWLPNSSHVIAANLGGDELLQYKLDRTKKTLNSLMTVKCPPGSGPRHMVIHPNGGFVYVTDELSNTVGVYKINKDAALLASPALQKITTLPPGFTSTNTAADIYFSSNGKFVYVSNRGDNSIVAYMVNADGTLKALSWTKSRGVTPRSFIIYKDWLIVANQGSDDMYVFKVDGDTGALKYTGNSYAIDGAVSLYVAEY